MKTQIVFMLISDQIYQKFHSAKKQLFVLVDPDKFNLSSFASKAVKESLRDVDLFLIGGSLLSGTQVKDTVDDLKKITNCPLVLFPGRSMQLTDNIDAVLFLSLISSRNPEFLIGQQVQAAPFIYHHGIESIPTSYILIDGGKCSSVQYITHSMPVPADKIDLALATALAGKYLGHKLIYLEAGSGAKYHVPEKMISKISLATKLPIIVGGGIKTAETARKLYDAGASALVIGTAFEENPKMLPELIKKIKNT